MIYLFKFHIALNLNSVLVKETPYRLVYLIVKWIKFLTIVKYFDFSIFWVLKSTDLA